MDEEQNNEQQVVDPAEDYFPTSAKPIFVRLGLLIAVIVGLCLVVYLQGGEKEEVEAPKIDRSGFPTAVE